jgi:hypothetical protein
MEKPRRSPSNFTWKWKKERKRITIPEKRSSFSRKRGKNGELLRDSDSDGR